MRESVRRFFALGGRAPAGEWLVRSVLALAAFLLVSAGVEAAVGRTATLPLYLALYWSLLALAIRRYHDAGYSGARLFLLLIPLAGLLWVGIELLFRGGTRGENRYGEPPGTAGLGYARVPGDGLVVTDVTQLYPVEVAAIATPRTVAEVQAAITRSTGPVSVGGGRFSMGGQTASPGSLHLDLRQLNQIIWLSPQRRAIRVEAGIRWCDIQRAIDPHDLAIQIMQTYANFTVGGALSVNCHGRYMGQGPLILSVRAIAIVLADGTLVEATPTENSDLFYGAIGGYGGLGVVVEVELSLAENTRVEQVSKVLGRAEYLEHFKQSVRSRPDAVFHNADLYAPRLERCRSVTWVRTQAPVTEPERLQPVRASHAMFRYLFWAVSETPFGPQRRQYLYEPLFYLRKRIHWRNYEAGYDVAELEPATRRWKTYVLQEYFVPIDRLDAFVPAMAEVFSRYRVNVLNVSIRHVLADRGSLLAWARQECFAFVVYYKQRVDPISCGEVAVWTRELIDVVLDHGGTWYLPYQPHGTRAQLERGYPRLAEMFALKARVDPDFRFRGAVWDTWYGEPEPSLPGGGAYRRVFGDVVWSDRFFLFLQNIYNIIPEAAFHHLIRTACATHVDDESIYRLIQEGLPAITPALAPLRFGLPALFAQKREITRQTVEILGTRRALAGVVEIGSTGRYVSALRKQVKVTGDVVLVNDVAPGGPIDMVERGQLRPLGRFVPLDDYAPLPNTIGDASVELVTCYIGLHHCPPERLGAFVDSIRRVLAPGGLFILRDHDVTTPQMDDFVGVVHSVFNAGLRVAWAVDAAERRHFRPCAEWVALLGERGFTDLGHRIRQPHDPTDNLLMAFAVSA